MKRISVLLLILVCAAFAFAQNPEAMIREMTGTVELKIGGSGNWVAAKAGDRIGKSTIISTSFKSTALLEVGNTTIMVRPLTRMSLDEIMSQEGTETISVGLVTGRVRVDAKPPAGNRMDISIQTPSAVASVRGTAFNMDPVNISVDEGLIRYSGTMGTGQAVQVSAGQASRIDEYGNAVSPLDMAESELLLNNMAGWAATRPDRYGDYSYISDFYSSSYGDLDLDVTIKPGDNNIGITITVRPVP